MGDSLYFLSLLVDDKHPSEHRLIYITIKLVQ